VWSSPMNSCRYVQLQYVSKFNVEVLLVRFLFCGVRAFVSFIVRSVLRHTTGLISSNAQGSVAMYEDPDFPANAQSLGPPRDAEAVKAEDVVWLRPHEILESTQYPEPTLFGDEATDNPG